MEYAQMRRKDRAIDEKTALEILEKGEYGLLSTVGEEGQPYGTPLSYVVDGEHIYFHCAREGHKLRNLRHNARACFTVVGATRPVFDDGFTTCYESTVVFGEAVRVEDAPDKLRILEKLCRKYLPDAMDHFQEDADKMLHVTDVWGLSMDHITGKARR